MIGAAIIEASGRKVPSPVSRFDGKRCSSMSANQVVAAAWMRWRSGTNFLRPISAACSCNISL
jgi:hypothetical protein